MHGNYVLQIVWATSNHLGCGATYCSNVPGWGKAYLLVCNYGPGLVFSTLNHIATFNASLGL